MENPEIKYFDLSKIKTSISEQKFDFEVFSVSKTLSVLECFKTLRSVLNGYK